MKHILFLLIIILIFSCNVDWSSNDGTEYIYIKIDSDTIDKECIINTSYYTGTIELPYEDTYKFRPLDSFILNLGISITPIEEDMAVSIYVDINGQKQYKETVTILLNETYRIYIEE